MVTWDEPKRQANINNHGLDFAGCDAVFDHPVIAWEDDREAYGEHRINLLGFLSGRIVQLTYTERGENLHVISLREATRNEIKRYRKEISRK